MLLLSYEDDKVIKEPKDSRKEEGESQGSGLFLSLIIAHRKLTCVSIHKQVIMRNRNTTCVFVLPEVAERADVLLLLLSNSINLINANIKCWLCFPNLDLVESIYSVVIPLFLLCKRIGKITFQVSVSI